VRSGSRRSCPPLEGPWRTRRRGSWLVVWTQQVLAVEESGGAAGDQAAAQGRARGFPAEDIPSAGSSGRLNGFPRHTKGNGQVPGG